MNSNQKIDIACIAHIAAEKCNCSRCKPLREVRQKCEAGTASPDAVLCLAEIDRLNLVWPKIAQEVGEAAVREISILEADINRLAKERDAAISDITEMAGAHFYMPCIYCKYGPKFCERAPALSYCHLFEWRGLQEGEEEAT